MGTAAHFLDFAGLPWAAYGSLPLPSICGHPDYLWIYWIRLPTTVQMTAQDAQAIKQLARNLQTTLEVAPLLGLQIPKTIQGYIADICWIGKLRFR